MAEHKSSASDDAIISIDQANSPPDTATTSATAATSCARYAAHEHHVNAMNVQTDRISEVRRKFSTLVRGNDDEAKLGPIIDRIEYLEVPLREQGWQYQHLMQMYEEVMELTSNVELCADHIEEKSEGGNASR